jgi:hypothetical protein
MSRRIAVAVLAAFTISLFSGAATSEASSGSVLPVPGTYMGWDAHHRTVTFTYTHSGEITHFRVNHTSFPNARVQGSQWHHTCANNYCSRGRWLDDYSVEGYWNVSTSGGDVFFEANLYSS